MVYIYTPSYACINLNMYLTSSYMYLYANTVANMGPGALYTHLLSYIVGEWGGGRYPIPPFPPGMAVIMESGSGWYGDR